MPNSFPLLSLNRTPIEMLDAEFYLKGLQRMGQVVTKEIYLDYNEFIIETNNNLFSDNYNKLIF